MHLCAWMCNILKVHFLLFQFHVSDILHVMQGGEFMSSCLKKGNWFYIEYFIFEYVILKEGWKHSATFADLDAFEQQCPLIHAN